MVTASKSSSSSLMAASSMPLEKSSSVSASSTQVVKNKSESTLVAVEVPEQSLSGASVVEVPEQSSTAASPTLVVKIPKQTKKKKQLKKNTLPATTAVESGETAFCKLNFITLSKQNQQDISKYPYINKSIEVGLEITQDLEPEVELLTDYNWDYHATRRLNMQKCHIQRDKNKMKMKQIGIALTEARNKKS